LKLPVRLVKILETQFTEYPKIDIVATFSILKYHVFEKREELEREFDS